MYHRPPYIDFARRQNGAADLLLLSSDGQQLLAFPFHPGPRRVTTGYAGVCFPPTSAEAPLRRAVALLAELSHLNPSLRLYSVQSAQAPAADFSTRQGVLGWLLDGLRARREPLHTRLLRLSDGSLAAAGASIEPGARDGDERLLLGYDADLRNQIRQAARRGVTVRVVVPGSVAEATEVYGTFLRIHEESWRRTGMMPHQLDYLVGLEAAVREGGGQDVVTLALDANGTPIAAVNCHRYGARAIYWSGCSLTAALPLRANPYCLHAAITAMQRLGVHTFELGRFRADEKDPKELSVTAYKTQFRGEVQRVLNFELGGPLVDARAVARSARSRLRAWRQQSHRGSGYRL
ncbi:MAG: GNAT family N-acetyltransferase [Pseudonocardiaceae bacterium]